MDVGGYGGGAAGSETPAGAYRGGLRAVGGRPGTMGAASERGRQGGPCRLGWVLLGMGLHSGGLSVVRVYATREPSLHVPCTHPDDLYSTVQTCTRTSQFFFFSCRIRQTQWSQMPCSCLEQPAPLDAVALQHESWRVRASVAADIAPLRRLQSDGAPYASCVDRVCPCQSDKRRGSAHGHAPRGGGGWRHARRRDDGGCDCRRDFMHRIHSFIGITSQRSRVGGGGGGIDTQGESRGGGWTGASTPPVLAGRAAAALPGGLCQHPPASAVSRFSVLPHKSVCLWV